MKKLVLAAAVIAALGLGACSGAKETDACKGECGVLTEKLQNCTNPDSLSVYVGQAKAYAEQLVKEGKVKEAKQYLDKITPVVDKYAPALSSTIASVKTVVDKIPDGATDAASYLQEVPAQNLGDTLSSAVEAVKDAGAEKLGEAKEKGADLLDQGKQKASDAADKANDAIQKALGN